jgi:DNA-directed RNA polymerase specialized sigma24 family protein
MASGMSYAQVAEATRRRPSTVRTLVHHAYQRLGVSTIAQALAVCTQVGWFDDVPQDGAIVTLADRRVTWAQRLYLEAFDQSLQAGDDPEELARTRQLREAALTGMCREAGVETPWRGASGDPIERIAQALQRLDTPRRAA